MSVRELTAEEEVLLKRVTKEANKKKKKSEDSVTPEGISIAVGESHNFEEGIVLVTD